MSRPYHALQPPHGMDTLSLPDDDVELRRFFSQCVERREFQEARSEREQVHLCARWSEVCQSRPSMRQLAEFFQISKSTVAYHLGRPFDVFDGCSASPVGRPGLLSQEQMTQLEHFVRHRFDLRLPVSYEDIRDFLQSEWGLVMNIGSLRTIVARSEALKTVDGQPLEDSRLFSSQEQIDGFGCHQTDEFLELAAEANIICKFIPPHTSDQLQPLDLGVFGNQKRWQGI